MSVSFDLLPLNGLVLAGGKSRRMGSDKANLRYGVNHDPQWLRMARLLKQVCDQVFVSVRKGQELDNFKPESGFSLLEDPDESNGPLTGLLEAFEAHPETAWIVVACDLPMLDRATLANLLNHRGDSAAVAYRSAHDGLPEPMCAIYEPKMQPILKSAFADGLLCPRKVLINNPATTRLLDLPQANALENANTPDEYQRLARQLQESLS